MAISLGSHSVGADNTGAVTDVATPLTTTTGSTIFVAVSHPDGDTFTSVTDAYGNTYTAIDAYDDTGNGFYVRTFYCQNATGGSNHWVRLTMGSTCRKVIYAAEVVGAKTVGALDQHSIAKDTGTPFDSAVTTTVASEIVFSMLRSSDVVNATFTLNGGFSTVDSNVTTTGSILGYRIVSATGTYSPAATCNVGTQAVVATASFSEASGGSSVAPLAANYYYMGA
jgi:hypothetical protein